MVKDKSQIKFDKGETTTTNWHVNDILISHSLAKFDEQTSFEASRDDDMVRLHFGLEGSYNFTHNQLQKTFVNIGGRHNLMYSKRFDIEVTNKSLELETFGIQFPKELFLNYTMSSNDLLKRFAENVLAGKSVLLSENWKHTNYPTRQVIQEILNCKYKGDLKELFLLSKSIELLVIACEAHSQKTIAKNKFINSSTDIEKIHAVKNLVNDKLSNPPNLSEIAKHVGLNEYKLKGGFKEIFGLTIFGYLREERLQLAYKLILDSQKSIAEISDELGYSSPQHFSNAFKKKYNFTPSSIRNNP